MVTGAVVVGGAGLVGGPLVVVEVRPADFDAVVHPAATTKTMTTALVIRPLDTFQGSHNTSCHCGRLSLARERRTICPARLGQVTRCHPPARDSAIGGTSS